MDKLKKAFVTPASKNDEGKLGISGGGLPDGSCHGSVISSRSGAMGGANWKRRLQRNSITSGTGRGSSHQLVTPPGRGGTSSGGSGGLGSASPPKLMMSSAAAIARAATAVVPPPPGVSGGLAPLATKSVGTTAAAAQALFSSKSFQSIDSEFHEDEEEDEEEDDGTFVPFVSLSRRELLRKEAEVEAEEEQRSKRQTIEHTDSRRMQPDIATPIPQETVPDMTHGTNISPAMSSENGGLYGVKEEDEDNEEESTLDEECIPRRSSIDCVREPGDEFDNLARTGFFTVPKRTRGRSWSVEDSPATRMPGYPDAVVRAKSADETDQVIYSQTLLSRQRREEKAKETGKKSRWNLEMEDMATMTPKLRPSLEPLKALSTRSLFREGEKTKTAAPPGGGVSPGPAVASSDAFPGQIAVEPSKQHLQEPKRGSLSHATKERRRSSVAFSGDDETVFFDIMSENAESNPPSLQRSPASSVSSLKSDDASSSDFSSVASEWSAETATEASSSDKSEDPYWIETIAGNRDALEGALFDAVVSDDVKTAKLLLDPTYGGVDPTAVESSTGRTALWYAASSGSIDCLRLLVQEIRRRRRRIRQKRGGVLGQEGKTEDLNAATNGQLSTTHTTSRINEHERVNGDAAAISDDDNSRDDIDLSSRPLSTSSIVSETPTAAAAVAANLGKATQRTDWGSNPLLIAAAMNRADAVEALLLLDEAATSDTNNDEYDGYGGHDHTQQHESVFDVDETNPYGSTACHVAAAEGHFMVLDVLIRAGADLNRTNNLGCTPAMLAAQNGKVDVLRYLNDFGVNLRLTNKEGLCCVGIACKENKAEVVQYLTSIANFNNPSKPDLNQCAARKGGEPPLYIAATKGNLEALRALIESPLCDISTTNTAGLSALHVAAWQNKLDVADALCNGLPLERLEGALNCPDARSGMTPLAYAVTMGHVDMVRLLAPLSDVTIQCGTSGGGVLDNLGVGSRDVGGVARGGGVGGGDCREPVLVMAANRDEVEIIKILLDAGAEIDQTDERGHTAISVAARNGHADSCEVLAQRGADLSIRSKRGGGTPLAKARKYKHTKVVEVLERYTAGESTSKQALKESVASILTNSSTMS